MKASRVVLLAFFRLLRRPAPTPTQSADVGLMVRVTIPPSSLSERRATAFSLPAATAPSANWTNCWNCVSRKRFWLLMVLGMEFSRS